MTPVEFLNARYTERHTAALAALAEPDDDGHWCTSGTSPSTQQCRVEGRGIIIYDEGGHTAQQAVFIAENNPAYVLADIAAKRAILEWHQNWPVLVEKQPTFDQPAMSTDFSSVTESVTVRLSRQIAWLTEQEYRNRFGSEPPTGPIIRLMLQPFAEHPDYDPRWTL